MTIEIENLKRASEEKVQDIIADLTQKKEAEGLSEIEEEILDIALRMTDIEQRNVEEKIQKEIQKSKDAGEDYFEDKKEEKKFSWEEIGEID